ncbi:hypothetical protein LguiA_021298 [Lonicera macranthoides]
MNTCETAFSSLFIAFQSWYQVPGCAVKRRCLKLGEWRLEWGLNHFLGLWRNNGRTCKSACPRIWNQNSYRGLQKDTSSRIKWGYKGRNNRNRVLGPSKLMNSLVLFDLNFSIFMKCKIFNFKY